MAPVQLFEHVAAVTGLTAAIRLDLRPLLTEPVDIGGDGHTIRIDWPGVAGATAAEITQATLQLYPAVAETLRTDHPFTADGGGFRVDIPAGERVRALGLGGLRDDAGTAITDALPPSRRLVVAFPPPTGGGYDSPRFAVPAVGAQGALPATLTGARLSAGTLTLAPAVAARRLRLTLAEGDGPADFATRPLSIGSLQLVTHRAAHDARLTGPAQEVLWTVPEFDPDAPAATVDLKQALKAAFDAALKAGTPLLATFRLQAQAPARCVVIGPNVLGALLRVHDGIASTRLEGEPLPLAAFADGPLADETPQSVRGDLTIRYDGLRLLEEASDTLPPPGSAVQGRIVGAAGALRAWPPAALQGRVPARIGVWGRAPEAAELALELVELRGHNVGATLAGPVLLKPAPGDGLRLHWALLPTLPPLPADVGLRLRCNVGRFFWAARADGEPLVRVAVADPDPGGRPVQLGGVQIAALHDTQSHQVGHAFPAAVFRGRRPLLDSALFVTVDASDLTLRYAR